MAQYTLPLDTGDVRAATGAVSRWRARNAVLSTLSQLELHAGWWVSLMLVVAFSVGVIGGMRGLEVSPTVSDVRASHVSPGVPDSASVQVRSVGQQVKFHRVRAGDTLWNIAATTYPQTDPRAALAFVREANGMSLGEDISLGQELRLPAMSN